MLRIFRATCQVRFSHLVHIRFYTSRNVLKLSERGLWHDHFPEPDLILEKALQSSTVTAYAGFDPTADSLHIGNLLVLTALLHFQRAGHKVIALIGGATGCIGDPSGRTVERPILDAELVKSNAEMLKKMIKRIFRNHEEFLWRNNKEDILPPLTILNNMAWHEKLKVINFLREVGKHMRMGTLIKRNTIQTRLESNEPLSFTEFTYQVLQAYDWLYLYRNYNCTVQIGGKDQLGNIVSGHRLINRIEGEHVSGLTVPIITNEAGDKFGKSSGECIWLDAKKTSTFEFYQYFIRVPDSEIEYLLKLLTFIPLKNIEHMLEVHRSKPEERGPQKKLAERMTLLVHGEDGLAKAKRATQLLYGGNVSVLADMSLEEVSELFGSDNVRNLLLEPGTSILDASLKAGCFANEADALRIITSGGFSINRTAITNPGLILIPGVHILSNGFSLFRVGKKQYFIVKWL